MKKYATLQLYSGGLGKLHSVTQHYRSKIETIMLFTLIAYFAVPLMLLGGVMMWWQRTVKKERRRTLENALKDYIHGMTMDEDPFLGQLKTRNRRQG
ncbi:MAG TPA: hypothetical protein VKY92_04890 [Verrucomicrobiae bacterium]|nr:hypothetical protein [Verrucomicrobiae bacterium]